MKIIHMNLKACEVKVRTENLDDLWYLSEMIDYGDLAKAKTLRKIKAQDKEQESKGAERRPIFLSIRVDNVEFHKYSDILRVSGTVDEATDEVPRGSHHTINVDQNTVLTLVKQSWPKYQLDRLQESAREKTPKILICIMDREEALFAALKKYGYDILSEFQGAVDKKVHGTLQKSSGDFYGEILKSMEDYDKRFDFDTIIVASPAFWKEEFSNYLKDHEIKRKIRTATCSSVTKNAGSAEAR